MVIDKTGAKSRPEDVRKLLDYVKEQSLMLECSVQDRYVRKCRVTWLSHDGHMTHMIDISLSHDIHMNVITLLYIYLASYRNRMHL